VRRGRRHQRRRLRQPLPDRDRPHLLRRCRSVLTGTPTFAPARHSRAGGNPATYERLRTESLGPAFAGATHSQDAVSAANRIKRLGCGERSEPYQPPRNSSSRARCRPPRRRFPGSSQRSNPRFNRGHSESRMENHAESRLLPFTTIAWRKHALEREAEPLGGVPRGRIQRIALPLVAAVAELVEHALHHQVHRLGRDARALHARREQQVPDFDRAVRRIDAEVCADADGVAGSPRRRRRGTAGPRSVRRLLGPGAIGLDAVQRLAAEVGPVAALGVEAIRGLEARRVASGVERLDAAIPALDRGSRRARTRSPARHGGPIGWPNSLVRGGIGWLASVPRSWCRQDCMRALRARASSANSEETRRGQPSGPRVSSQ
jgi:hypothetical protein